MHSSYTVLPSKFNQSLHAFFIQASILAGKVRRIFVQSVQTTPQETCKSVGMLSLAEHSYVLCALHGLHIHCKLAVPCTGSKSKKPLHQDDFSMSLSSVGRID